MKTKFKIRKLVFIISICTVCLGCNKIIGQEKPNIIIMMADDLGYGDVGCFGNKIIETPNIDQLASKGAKFTQFYSGHYTCSPSRAGMMAGRTPYRNGIYTFIADNSVVHLKDKEVTLAEICKEQGYDTGFFGKWGLNGNMDDKTQPTPSQQGFDSWLATNNNAIPSHKNPTNFYFNGKAMGEMKGYSSQIVVDKAMQWLDSRKDKTKPFLLVLWFHEPHTELAQPDKFTQKYAKYGEVAGEYYANIDHMDHQIGRFMNYMKKENLEDNSWITFTSDNGPLNREGRSTNGLRGYKARLYEGGLREPTVMYWKGKIEGAKVIDDQLTFFDFVPTFYDLFGMEPMNNEPLDGASMLPALEGKKVERKTLPIWVGRWKTTLINNEWKIIGKFKDFVPGTSYNYYLINRKIVSYELFNLKKDPYEKQNLSKANIDKLNEMKLLIEERVRSVQKEIVPWNGQWVLPYGVVKYYNPNVPPYSEFSKLSPEEQDLMKSKQ